MCLVQNHISLTVSALRAFLCVLISPFRMTSSFIPETNAKTGKLLIVALVLPYCTVPVASQAATSCDAWKAAAAAFEADSLFGAVEAAKAAKADEGCSGVYEDQIRRWAALAHQSAAFAEGLSRDQRRETLIAGLSFDGAWQLEASLGDLAREDGDYAEAARHYHRARLDALELADAASQLTPKPDQVVLDALRQRFDEARLASEDFVAMEGRPACEIDIGNALMVKTVSPVRFEFNSTEFSEAGEKAVLELGQCLGNLDPSNVSRITVIGHTDERGTDEYNDELSMRRAEAVVDFLRLNGIRLPLRMEGRGEREPYQPDSPSLYDSETLERMNRRVEVDVIIE